MKLYITKNVNQVFHRNPINLIVLKLKVIYSRVKCQSNCYSVSYGATALKIYHDIEHQKSIDKSISQNVFDQYFCSNKRFAISRTIKVAIIQLAMEL